MALTETYVDPSINADSGSGTIGDPYGDLQYALDTMTRDSTNGDRINIKSGTAEVMSAAVDLTAYGTPAHTAPLVFQGYDSAAGDGGMAEIDLNGGTYGFATNGLYRHFRDLEIHNGTGSYLLRIGSGQYAINCYLHDGTNDGLWGTSGGGMALGCRIEDCGRYGVDTLLMVAFCYFKNGTKTFTRAIYRTQIAYRNMISIDGASVGIWLNVYYAAIGNSIYSSAGTGYGIESASHSNILVDNLIEGFSGSGGQAVKTTGNCCLLNNAYYDCETGVDGTGIAVQEGTTALGASPFAKSGAETYANRLAWFSPVAAVRGLAFPTKGADGSGLTETYVDPSIDADSGSGTIGDPYGDLQYALDTMTRDSTNGDRINVKSGTAEVLSADLSTATYGTPSTTAPLVIQGYDSVAGDGGVAEIDCNVSYDILAKSYTHWVDLEIHNTTQVYALAANQTGQWAIRCYVHNAINGINLATSGAALGCRLTDIDTYSIVGSFLALRNHFAHPSTDSKLPVRVITGGITHLENILSISGPVHGIYLANYDVAMQNSVLSDSAGSAGTGIFSSSHSNLLANNLAEGFDHASGEGINSNSGNDCVINNAAYDNGTNISFADDSPPFNTDNSEPGASLFAKEGDDTFANRAQYFAPADVGTVRGGAYAG